MKIPFVAHLYTRNHWIAASQSIYARLYALIENIVQMSHQVVSQYAVDVGPQCMAATPPEQPTTS
ncbi:MULTISPECIES: hypothetical protein [unclassified Pseudomonas]|uniref:hypothetical protein n=1 Tax=unclassified Pseudomonas TaxID=196821 RepID=UPI0030D921DA